jgi:nucleoside-diphosphate-sugar epimerase
LNRAPRSDSEERVRERVALIVGAHGVVGRHVAGHMHTADGWRVVGASRRAEPPVEGMSYVSVDLLDREGAVRALSGCADTTHLMFAGYQWSPQGFLEETSVNVALLENAVEALLELGAPLRHVTVYHGTRAYGGSFGQFPIPARESDPRIMPPNFYYGHEDYLRERSVAGRFTYTIFRPDIVCGVAIGTSTSIVAAVGLYATICKELGVPLRYPGPQAAYDTLLQFTDARLIGRATEWAAESPAAANEIFNIANGDQFRWRRLWPRIADYFEMPQADPMHLPLDTLMADKGPVWDRVAEHNDLQRIPLDELVSWKFADRVFSRSNLLVTSTIKIRNAGFGDCIDSEEMFIELLDDMRARRLLP